MYSYLRSKTKRQKLDSSWNRITENITFNNIEYFSHFISHFCSHLYGKTKKNDEFKTIRSNVDKLKAEKLLVSLLKNSNYYSYFLEPEKLKQNNKFNDSKVFIALKYFKDLNIRQVRPLLLSLFEKFDNEKMSKKDFVACINCLEIFYFLYSTLLKNTTNTIDNSIINLSKNILSYTGESNYKYIKNELQKYISETDKAIESFKYLGYSNKNKKFKNSSNRRVINYIFYKFEKYYDENDEIEPKITSIEHINNDSESNDYMSYIGNLLPLSVKLNNKIADKSYDKKIEYYKKSKLFSVKEFLENNASKNEWTNEDIINRGNAIARLGLSKIWIFDK